MELLGSKVAGDADKAGSDPRGLAVPVRPQEQRNAA
jgi:hypothetical protein